MPLSLNLGLRRDFTWRFVVANVTRPIIGVDFLSHFGLLVDCRNNRLLDGVTSLSVLAQAPNALIPSVKTILSGTPIDSLLAKFPDPLVQPESSAKSATTRSTISGLLQAHRSPADRGDWHWLTIDKAEFEAMLRDGTARRSESSWSSALHIVPKMDNRWRPCGDYRALNSRTIPDRYPVRHIHESCHQLFGCSIF
jgi:hypothetical protein